MSKCQVVAGAQVVCTMGTAFSPLTPSCVNDVLISGRIMATVNDAVPGVHYAPFGICLVTQQPCVPAPVQPLWSNPVSGWVVKNLTGLVEGAYICCAARGILSIATPGQATLKVRQNQRRLLEELREEARREQERIEQIALDAEAEQLRLTAELQIELAKIGLDVAGAIEPTPMADGASFLLSAGTGDTTGMFLSGASLIPYVGDALAKPIKLGRLTRRVNELREQIVNSQEIAQLARAALQASKNKHIQRLSKLETGVGLTEAGYELFEAQKRAESLERQIDLLNEAWGFDEEP